MVDTNTARGGVFLRLLERIYSAQENRLPVQERGEIHGSGQVVQGVLGRCAGER